MTFRDFTISIMAVVSPDVLYLTGKDGGAHAGIKLFYGRTLGYKGLWFAPLIITIIVILQLKLQTAGMVIKYRQHLYELGFSYIWLLYQDYHFKTQDRPDEMEDNYKRMCICKSLLS